MPTADFLLTKIISLVDLRQFLKKLDDRYQRNNKYDYKAIDANNAACSIVVTDANYPNNTIVEITNAASLTLTSSSSNSEVILRFSVPSNATNFLMIDSRITWVGENIKGEHTYEVSLLHDVATCTKIKDEYITLNPMN